MKNYWFGMALFALLASCGAQKKTFVDVAEVEFSKSLTYALIPMENEDKSIGELRLCPVPEEHSFTRRYGKGGRLTCSFDETFLFARSILTSQIQFYTLDDGTKFILTPLNLRQGDSIKRISYEDGESIGVFHLFAESIGFAHDLIYDGHIQTFDIEYGKINYLGRTHNFGPGILYRDPGDIFERIAAQTDRIDITDFNTKTPGKMVIECAKGKWTFTCDITNRVP